MVVQQEPRMPRRWRRWVGAWRRWSLWMLLVALVASMLVTLVWLAGRYEASQVQTRLERDTQDAVADIRKAFAHNIQSLQALQAHNPDLASWESRAAELLSARRELARIEWRDTQLRVRAHSETPYRPLHWDPAARSGTHSEIALACSNARRISGPSYSSSYFQPMPDGMGGEMLEVCLPLIDEGRLQGFLVATRCRPCWWTWWRPACSARRRCRSPRPTARGWRWWAPCGAARACSRRSSCSTCPAPR
jgi:two-component system sensor histidine kinase DctS